jgi:hypothetical protein
MSIPARFRILPALVALLATRPALTQVTTTASAPIPSILASAHRIFISNAGSDSYGSESYFWRTAYDGGPNRFYIQFYAAMKSWGRFTLTDSPTNAEVVYEVRFSDPVIDRGAQTRGDFIDDPQLNLKMLDPQTRVVLWALTEHIEPARTLRGANKNFDDAVARMVARVKAVVTDSMRVALESGSRIDMAPPGAIAIARREAHIQHATLGAVLGGGIGSLLWHPKGLGQCDASTCSAAAQASMRRFVTLSLSSTAIGAIIGWLWPTI